MSREEKVIMFDSPEAAQPHKMSGWVGGGGFYADERTARYAGCTHRKCDACGAVVRKHYTLCPACREQKDTERYHARERKPWDGKAMLYSDAFDRWYWDLDEAADALEEGQTLEDLRLLICEPMFAEIDAEHFHDLTPEGGELPDAVLEAIEAFNKACADIVCCWQPGEFALELDPAA